MKKFDLLEGKDYIVVSTQRLYPGFVGTEQWVIVTNLTEEDLRDKYLLEIERFRPWIMISLEQYSVMVEWKRNEEKHARRARFNFYFSVEDEYVEKKLGDNLLTETLEETFFRDSQGCLDCLDHLKPIQKKRIEMYYLEEMSLREIAASEGRSLSPIVKSVKNGTEKIKKYYQC